MADIFLSYVREDVERARPLVQVLEDRGWSVFWDEQLTPGPGYRQSIEQELDEAKCVVVLWSKLSIKSKWVIDEAEEGDERNTLISVLVERVKPPLGLRQGQSADLVDWRAGTVHQGLDRLVKGIAGYVPPQPPATPATKGPAAKTSPKRSATKKRSASAQTGERSVTPVGDIELVQLPAGSCTMGSPASEAGRLPSEGPQHQVAVPAFAIGRYAVTNEEYARFLSAHPDATEPQFWGNDDYNQPRQPAVGIDWEEAGRFAAWVGGRLPTEAEWEYAARAGTTAPFLVGSTAADLDRVAWYDDNSGGSLHPVRQKEPNAWGLYDVLGNVWEWVEDDWHGSYDGAPDNGAAWVDEPRRDRRVLRGGSFLATGGDVRAADRYWSYPDYRNGGIGFRVVGVPILL